MTDRELFFAALSAYRGIFPAEAATVERFEELAADWPTCLDRTWLPGHLTASAWVCDPSGGRVILTLHRKLGAWLQLGGHCDGQSAVPEAAVREAYEEAGVSMLIPARGPYERGSEVSRVPREWRIFDLDVHPIPEVPDMPAHLHFDVRFAYWAPDEFDPVASDESDEVSWFDLAELDQLGVDGSILRMRAKWREYYVSEDAAR